MNRCLILPVDESKAQTERIHALQRKARTLEGLRMKKQKRAALTLLPPKRGLPLLACAQNKLAWPCFQACV